LSKIFYKDAKVVIFVYDITNEKSFEEIKNFWYKSVKNDCENMPILAVVANKSHKFENQQVDFNKAESFADEIGAIFQESSKLSNDGINNLFENIGRTYLIPGFNYKKKDEEKQKEFLKKKMEQKKGIKEKMNDSKKGEENKKVKDKKNKKCIIF
jgi:GTPase SAR1 family protein